MNKLGLLDDAFLRLEGLRLPLHIGMLALFEPPPAAGKEFTQQLAERLRQSTKAAAPFNRRLIQRRGMNYWEEDEQFDLDNHFVHLSLPNPGRVRELLEMVSRVHGAHLDRAYPLWRMYLIEGLDDGRIAVYIKIHHALVDGVAGMRLFLKSMSRSAAESSELPPPWEVQTRKSKALPLPVPNPAAGSLPALRSLAREGFKSMLPLARELRTTYDDLQAENPDLTVYGQAPQTLFNAKISATRRFAAQSYSTARIRAVAQAFDATVNDVVLAMCGSALRRYLSDLHELPAKPLIAAVPISLRSPGSAGGNEIAFTMTTLATQLQDPVARLRAIKSGMDYNKQRLKKLSPGQLLAYTALMMIPASVKSMLGLAKESAPVNLVVSHVPGPHRPMYWQGAKLSGLYPISLCTDDCALNITLVSRHDLVDFGLIACRKTVPSMQRLLDYLEDGLTELEISIKPVRKTKTSGAAKRKPTTKKNNATKKPAAATAA